MSEAEAEVWAPMFETEGCEISSLGGVRRAAMVSKRGDGPIRVQGKTFYPKPIKGRGYAQFTLLGKKYYLHREILRAFTGMAGDALLARHMDGEPSNNVLSNLRWGSESENQMDRVRHGSSNRGSRHGNAKLSEAEVEEILSAKNKYGRELAAKYGVCRQHIDAIRRGDCWNHAGMVFEVAP
jgi:hypothetical protein